MKFFKVSLLAIILFSVSLSQAQEKKNVIKFNALGVLGSQFQLAYERGLTEKVSIQLSAGYITYNSSQTVFSNSYKSKNNGFIIIPEARYYFKEALDGAYLGAFARVRSVNTDLTDTSVPIGIDVSREEIAMTVGGGIVVGYQFILAERIVIDLFLGPQFKERSSSNTYKTYGVTDTDFNSKFIDFKVKDKGGLGVRMGVNFGIAF